MRLEADNAQRAEYIQGVYAQMADVLRRAKVPHVVLKGFTLAPDYVGARESLAKLYLQQNDPGAAIIQIDAALAQSGLRETFLELRGDAHARLGDLAGAKADWAEALKLAADRVDRARVSRKLRS